MKKASLFFLLLIIASQAFSQLNSKVNIDKIFKAADSVLLISHVDIKGSTNVFVDSTGAIVALPPLLIDNKVNESVIRKKIILNKSKLVSLINILSRPYNEKIVLQAGCFTSHHAILLIKKQKASFIDLCFGCNHYETSADLQNINPFDKRKWKELSSFFKNEGFIVNEKD